MSGDAKTGVEQLITAFNNAMRASLDTITKVSIEKLGGSSPNEFALEYCSQPMAVFGIQIKNLEIRKEQKLKFYSLKERQGEFLPVIKMNEITSSDCRLAVLLTATDALFEYTVSLIYYIGPQREISLDDAKVIEVRPIGETEEGDMIHLSKVYDIVLGSLGKTIISSLIVEAIKKLFGV